MSGGTVYSGDGYPNVTTVKRNLYKAAGTGEGPYFFNLSNGAKVQSDDNCDNGRVWTDSKGRIWTFNSENKMICVDVNGAANPNMFNIDTFAFIPMSGEQVAAYVYDDLDNPSDYSGEIVICDLDRIQRVDRSNKLPSRDANGKYVVNKDNPQSALDLCPFNEPLEDIASINGYKKGKSSKNKNITIHNNYWKDYIDYK
jgi:hypothetical protein